MKIAIITDQHFGARKGSKLFHEYFKQFYDDSLSDGGNYSDYNSIKDSIHSKSRS